MPPPRRLVECPAVVLHVWCALCPRRGRYRLARLAERHGADALLTDVLKLLAAGCREPRCGARFDDGPPEPPPPLPPPVTGVALRRHGPPREALPPRRRD